MTQRSMCGAQVRMACRTSARAPPPERNASARDNYPRSALRPLASRARHTFRSCMAFVHECQLRGMRLSNTRSLDLFAPQAPGAAGEAKSPEEQKNAISLQNRCASCPPFCRDARRSCVCGRLAFVLVRDARAGAKVRRLRRPCQNDAHENGTCETRLSSLGRTANPRYRGQASV